MMENAENIIQTGLNQVNKYVLELRKVAVIHARVILEVH
uniref:Uncharacterized protein n=1 Tax=Tetranychus urticae TaxID=32264 RepID=T1L5T6_TETUR